MELTVLKQTLREIGMTQIFLANQLEVSRSYICMLLTGKQFSLATARRIWLTLPRSVRTDVLAEELATAALASNSALRVCNIDIDRLLDYLDYGDETDDSVECQANAV